MKKQENNKLIKTCTDQKAREIILDGIMVEDDPRVLMRDFKENMLPEYLANEKGVGKKLRDKTNKLLMALGLDTHFPLLKVVGEKYRSLVLETTRRIEKEYDCQTASEIMLAEIIATSHVRNLELEKEFKNFTKIEFLSSEKNTYYSVMSKEIDRTYRRMIQVLTLLKQMKQPPIEMNIRAQNAFVSQNQQINVTKKDNENNESK